MRKPLLIGLLLLLLVNIVHAQAPVITLTVDAGFDGHFRDSQWMPIEIHASNDGDPASGRLVVRPETSGTGITLRAAYFRQIVMRLNRRPGRNPF